VQGQTVTLTELNVNSLNFNSIDKSVINARMQGEAICDIRKEELSILADVSIFKIAAIVGFSLPTSDKFADVLNEELLILLNQFGYSEITFEELILAFRINAQNYRTPSGETLNPIIPYSTFFSINFAASVLNKYMQIRKIVENKMLDKSAQEIAKKYV